MDETSVEANEIEQNENDSSRASEYENDDDSGSTSNNHVSLYPSHLFVTQNTYFYDFMLNFVMYKRTKI